MTLPTPSSSPAAPAPDRPPFPPSRAARYFTWARLSYEILALLVLAGFLAWDRFRLFQEYLYKFTDEDQTLQWYAAREILHGRLHEPCFYGQAYNSCIEGYLAAPLYCFHVPAPIAVPLVSLLLGLLPFILIAIIAFRRRQTLVAALALFIPLVLDSRYGVITGMPRGFITGVAFACIPALLFLPPIQGKQKTPNPGTESLGPPDKIKPPRLRRSHPNIRYFTAAFIAVAALMFNPNCAVLLIAVALYGLLTTFREWRFWLFTTLGLLAAAPYPYYAYKFYYVWHPDYVIYPFPDRAAQYYWSWAKFHTFLKDLSDLAFRDFVPADLYQWATSLFQWCHTRWPGNFTDWCLHHPAPAVLALIFAAVLVFLLVRLRLFAVVAGLVAIALVIIAFANGRIADARTSVSFPYARMWVAVPVLLLWLLMLNPRKVRPPRPLSNVRWRKILRLTGKCLAPASALALLTILVWVGIATARAKERILPQEVVEMNRHAQVANPVPVAEAQRIAAAIQPLAEQYHVSLVVLSADYNGKKWACALPELTTCDTLFPSFERRTWRLVEECVPRYEKILILGTFERRRSRIPPTYSATVVSANPPLTLVALNGRSVIDFCKATRGLEPRFFKAPPAPPAPATTKPKPSVTTSQPASAPTTHPKQNP